VIVNTFYGQRAVYKHSCSKPVSFQLICYNEALVSICHG